MLFGSDKMGDDKSNALLTSTIEFIQSTERFRYPLFHYFISLSMGISNQRSKKSIYCIASTIFHLHIFYFFLCFQRLRKGYLPFTSWGLFLFFEDKYSKQGQQNTRMVTNLSFAKLNKVLIILQETLDVDFQVSTLCIWQISVLIWHYFSYSLENAAIVLT